jgi:maltose alpha-D-glucosyltransferase / alpha-amylase
VSDPELGRLSRWIDYWLAWTDAAFLRSYLETLGDSLLIPPRSRSMETLLDLYYVERCVNVLEHDLKSRSAELALSLRQTKQFLEAVDQPRG